MSVKEKKKSDGKSWCGALPCGISFATANLVLYIIPAFLSCIPGDCDVIGSFNTVLDASIWVRGR